jgi:hypothetical protein
VDSVVDVDSMEASVEVVDVVDMVDVTSVSRSVVVDPGIMMLDRVTVTNGSGVEEDSGDVSVWTDVPDEEGGVIVEPETVAEPVSSSLVAAIQTISRPLEYDLSRKQFQLSS